MRFRDAILGFGLLWASLSAVRQGECAEEPHYEGRSLTSWIGDLAQGRFPDMERHHAAEKAIRAIGAEALPVLMNRVKTTEEDPALLLNDAEKRDVQTFHDVHTISAFRALGPAAYSEIPALIELLAPQYDAASESSSEPDYWLKYRSSELAGSALNALDAGAVDPLLKSLGSEDPKIRFGAVAVLEDVYWPSKDERIAPEILKTLLDKDAKVRWMSARALGAIHTLPETCVPALAERVRDDPADNVRCYALMALEKFGPRAQAAVPEVKAATLDENSVIRYYAAEALKAIQVDAPASP